MCKTVSWCRFGGRSWLRLNRLGIRPQGISLPTAAVLGLCCAGLLSGCGFHLRGKVVLPEEMSRTYVTGLPRFTEFGANLRRQLRANGVAVVESVDDSTATLRITRNQTGKRILSVNDKGKVQEYELSVSVAFEVKGQDTILLENQTENPASL